MKTISMKERTGTFAENKDIALSIRQEHIMPALQKGEEVALDFTGVEAATQSFIHALISDLIRSFGPAVLDKILFKGCNETVKKIITIVSDYMQASEA